MSFGSSFPNSTKLVLQNITISRSILNSSIATLERDHQNWISATIYPSFNNKTGLGISPQIIYFYPLKKVYSSIHSSPFSRFTIYLCIQPVIMGNSYTITVSYSI